MMFNCTQQWCGQHVASQLPVSTSWHHWGLPSCHHASASRCFSSFHQDMHIQWRHLASNSRRELGTSWHHWGLPPYLALTSISSSKYSSLYPVAAYGIRIWERENSWHLWGMQYKASTSRDFSSWHQNIQWQHAGKPRKDSWYQWELLPCPSRWFSSCQWDIQTWQFSFIASRW